MVIWLVIVHSAGILIVGSSFVERLDNYLRNCRGVLRVPLPVKLIGKGGLKLQDLRSLLDKEANSARPAYIIIHVGANDITDLSSYAWRRELEASVAYIQLRYPNSRLIWSDMLPRQHWRNAISTKVAEKSRKRCQLRARALFSQEGGEIISHNLIHGDQFLSTDGVHLSETGQQVFREDLEDGILRIMGWSHNV